jgi:phospholipid transport system transporter-binding protein
VTDVRHATLRVDGTRVAVDGPLTLDAVAALLRTPVRWQRGVTHTIDLGAAGPVDSAAIALLLDWQRSAAAAGARLEVVARPPGLASLASLYGIESLLPAGVAA